jgi:hypothetical protein
MTKVRPKKLCYEQNAQLYDYHLTYSLDYFL